MRNLRFFLPALFVAALCAAPCGAAIVYTKDGGKLEGEVVRSSADGVEVTVGGTTVKIPADKILRIEDSKVVAPPVESPAPISYPVRRVRRWRRWIEPSPVSVEDYPNTLNFMMGFTGGVSGVTIEGSGAGSLMPGDGGAMIGMQYLYSLDSRWAVGWDLAYADRGVTHSQSVVSGTDASILGDQLTLLGLAKYSFVDAGRIRPYVEGGLGPARNAAAVDAQPLPGYVWGDTSTDETRRLIEGSGWTWAGSVRVGVDFISGPQVASLEMGWTHLGSRRFPATADGAAQGISSLTGAMDSLSFGGRIGWRF